MFLIVSQNFVSFSLHKVEAKCNEVPGTFKINLFYAACVIMEASDIMNSHYAISLYLEGQL